MDLPYPLVYALWSIAAILALGAALYLLCGVLPPSRPARWTMIAAACSYQPVHIALWQGQTSTFMLLGLCGAYAALARRREALAGAALTLLAFKPQFVPVVLLLLVLRRHWVALASFAGLQGGVYVAALPVLGAAWPVQAARLLVGESSWDSHWSEQPLAFHTWRGLAADLASGWAPGLVWPLFAVLSLAACGLLLWAWWRARATVCPPPGAGARDPNGVGLEPSRDLLWALAGIVIVLVSPHCSAHDLTLLIFPGWIAGVYATSGRWDRRSSRVWVALLWTGYVFPVLYALGPLAVATLRHPIVAVGPDVLLMAVAAGLLARQVAASGRARVVARAP